MVVKAALGTLVIFLGSSIWLYLAWSHGNRTNQWTAVPAVIIKNDVQESNYDRSDTRGPMGWKTTVKYTVDGIEHEAVVDEYLIGSNQEVFVDPNNPASVVGKQGATIQATAYPLVATVASGLFALVLVLIAVSPKEVD